MIRAGRLAETATLAGVTAATAVSFCRVFPGWSFLATLLVCGAVAHVAALLTRSTRAIVAVPVALVVLMVVVTWLHLPETTAYGIPTRATFDEAWRELSATWAQIGVAVPPVAFRAGFALASMLAIGVAAIAADAIAMRARSRVEAVVPTGIVFVAVSAVGYDRARAGATALWLGAALAHVATTRAVASTREGGWIGTRRVTRSLATAGVAVALLVAPAAAVIAPHLPGADAEPLLEPRVRDGGSGGGSLTPFVDIRGRLADRSDAVLFSVDADEPAYWRMASMSDFDGNVWSIAADDLTGAGGELEDPRPYGVALRQRVHIDRLTGNLVPVAASPVGLRSSDVDLFYANDSGTLVVADPGLSNGDQYDIVSSTPRPPADVLAAASVSADDEHTALPATWDPSLTAVARRITAEASSPYEQALALQNWFRRDFTYDLGVRLDSSVDAISQFLEMRRGYCEQFAGTFAALARSLGLPTRVAIGFTPGDVGADGTYRVRSRHAHAWPEVRFDGLGWISFEPTPGRGEPGAEGRTGVNADQAGRDSVDTDGVAGQGAGQGADGENSSDGGSSVTTLPGNGTNDGTGSASGTPGEPVSVDQGSSPWRWLLIAPLALALWAVVMPRVVARRIRSTDPDQRVVDDWNASVAAMHLAGVRVDPSATPREAATYIARHSGLDRNELVELATAATVVLYGNGVMDPRSRTRCRVVGRHVRESAVAVVPRGWRLRARFDPRTAAVLLRG